MEITTPDATDAEELCDLWVSLAESQRTHDSHLLPEANRSQIRETIVRHVVSDRILVAKEEDIIGFVMFATETGSYEQDATRGIIENLYVVPDERNEGIGTQLLKRAETRLAETGVDTIVLEVMAPNEAARRFYRKRGYRPHRIELEKSLEKGTDSTDK